MGPVEILYVWQGFSSHGLRKSCVDLTKYVQYDTLLTTTISKGLQVKILIINPNTSVEATERTDTIAKKYARADTEIKTVASREGPLSIRTYYEIDLTSQAVLERVIEGNKQKFDAIVIACYGDPHLESAREISEVPVYGIAEASMHMASMLGYKFSIVAFSKRAVPIFEVLVRKIGLESRCASIRTIGRANSDSKKNTDAVRRALIKAAQAAIEEDGAEVICLGCAGMAGLDKPMEEQLKVPVLDGVVCAVKIAEAIFDYKLKHSKINAFKRPLPEKWVGMKQFSITD